MNHQIIKRKRVVSLLISVAMLFSFAVLPIRTELPVFAQEVDALTDTECVLLMEASTGTVLYETNSTEHMRPASITKIMSLILIWEAIEKGSLALTDDVVTSEHAKSMTGSIVYLETGEIQTVETLIKCIVVSSGNDACVAMAEHIAGSEEAFVSMMNEKAEELGMEHTHFVDCCGLTDSEEHYTCAYDVALMSKELITKYPQIYNYTSIWMEDITHTTAQGSKEFTLSSTNKLLKQYEWTTGLKTGYTSLAMHCVSATANRDGIDLIAVVLGAKDSATRFQDAITLLNYGFSVCQIYQDLSAQSLPPLTIANGVKDSIAVSYESGFTYLDTTGKNLSDVTKRFSWNEAIIAPITEGETVGEVIYEIGGSKIGTMPIISMESVDKANYFDYFKRVGAYYLIN